MSNFRIILKNGDNVKGGIHPNSSDIERLFSPFSDDLCPHGIYLHNKICEKGCHLLIDDRLYLPGRNISFLEEKKILGQSIIFRDRLNSIICKFKHSKTTVDIIVGKGSASDKRHPSSLLFGKNWETHSTVVYCKRCGILFKKTVWDKTLEVSGQ